MPFLTMCQNVIHKVARNMRIQSADCYQLRATQEMIWGTVQRHQFSTAVLVENLCACRVHTQAKLSWECFGWYNLRVPCGSSDVASKLEWFRNLPIVHCDHAAWVRGETTCCNMGHWRWNVQEEQAVSRFCLNDWNVGLILSLISLSPKVRPFRVWVNQILSIGKVKCRLLQRGHIFSHNHRLGATSKKRNHRPETSCHPLHNLVLQLESRVPYRATFWSTPDCLSCPCACRDSSEAPICLARQECDFWWMHTYAGDWCILVGLH